MGGHLLQVQRLSSNSGSGSSGAVVIIKHPPFALGATYQVVISADVQSEEGDILGVSTDWWFTIGAVAECTLDAALVTPPE